METGSQTNQGIIAGDHPLSHQPVTVLSGQGVLVRGTVMGRITASGKVVKSLTASADGSQTPYCILAEDVDATSADAVAPAYFEGQFAAEMLTYGAAHSATTVEAAFRASSTPIYLKNVGAVA